MTATDLDTFTDELRAFLDERVPRRPSTQDREWGEGPDDVINFGATDTDEARMRDEAIEWRRTLYDHGYGWITGPAAYGGQGLPADFEDRFMETLGEYETPDQGIFQVSRGMVSPAILEHGTDELKERFLPAIHRGDIVCSQLLSEPEAGSDLAGLKTRAVRDGDEWVVNGQKVWSSYAHVAHYGQLLARTDPDAPKHQGLTMFMLPLDTPGVEVRPLRQMNGQAHFNEVFMDNVRVPHSNRVGEPGGGWRAILTTLMNERHVVANRGGSVMIPPVERLIELASELGVADEATVRQRLAEEWTTHEILRFVRLRQEAAVEAGRQPGPEGSISKLLYTAHLRRVADIAGELLGPAMTADSGDWGTYAWARFLCSAPGLRIAGGTDNIQRNTIAERALGLPKEPKPT